MAHIKLDLDQALTLAEYHRIRNADQPEYRTPRHRKSKGSK